ncbi:ATP12-domain-containing protein, partial [Mytilinidion resinicola]
METLRSLSSLGRLSSRRIPARRTHLPIVQCLHTSPPRPANPLPHPVVSGAPPDPPVSDVDERVARKKRQVELLKRAQELRASPSKSKGGLLKRFWKDVSVKETPDGHQVFLDTRPVRTPTKDILTVPHGKHHLAAAIALEWDLLVSIQQALKTHNIPMTSLASRALDIQAADADEKSSVRNDIVKMMMRYLATDTLLCWAPEKNIHDAPQLEERAGTETLRKLQIRVAKPIIAHLTTKVWPGVEITPITQEDSILPLPQPDMTKDVIRGWLSGLPAYELAGLERAVLASKSLLVGVRLLVEWSEHLSHLRDEAAGDRFGIEEAAEAASLEVRWQTGM